MAGETAAQPDPVVRSVSPDSGTIGDEVTITGSGLAGLTGVRFGAAAGKFTVDSASQVTATVPAQAASGPVTVTGPQGTASSPGPFAVTPGIALSPPGGPAATTVTVAGAGFGVREAVEVYLGAAVQALAVASGTGNFAGITVQVPASAVAGAVYLTAVGRHSGLGAQAPFSVRNVVTVTNPGTLQSPAGGALSLPVQARDSASGQALTYAAAGLPGGLSIGPSTGLISGTPVAAGTFTVTVTASDTTGASGSATFTWIIAAVSVTVTTPPDQAGIIGAATSLQIHASTSPSGLTIEYAAAGLPPGLSVTAGTGLISGMPSAPGIFTVTVTASAGGVSGSATFTWTIKPDTVTVTNPGNQTVLGPASLQINAASLAGLPLTYAAAGLPPGLSINPSTGLISGVPTTAGDYTVTVSAQDTAGAFGFATFTWTT